MRTTIDKAGRIVIPKELRDRVGLQPGDVDITVDGSGLHIEVVASDHLVSRGKRLVVPAEPGTASLTDDDVEALRDADRR